MQFDDLGADGEAEPEPGLRLIGVELSKFLEHGGPLRLGNAGSGIGDDHLDAVGARGGGLEQHEPAARREFDRVRDEVVNQALDEPLVGFERRRSALEEASRNATEAYKSRMPTSVYKTLIAESVRRKILQRFSLPRFLLAEIE